MNMTVVQMRALAAICQTFLPAEAGWPSAADMGVAEAIAAALPDPAVTGRSEPLLQLLDLWNSRLHSLFTVARLAPFAELPHDVRTRMLLNWSDSALAARRGAFQALRKAVGYLYVMLPGENGAPSRVWSKFGFPGPLGTQRHGAARSLRVMIPDHDMDLTADVCVIGSGAGGGTAAAVLAAAGQEVLVLEAGGYYDDTDFDGAELAGFTRLYLEQGFAATANHSVGLLAGECLGGGTVVNYCTSFETPDEIRREWAATGIPWFASEEYSRSLNAVGARLSVNRDYNRVSAREEVMRRGLASLGWHVDAMPRNVIGCDQGRVCGYCGYGCAIGAKQSTAKTFLVDAQTSGARILVQTRALRVRIEAGAVKAVEARTKSGHRITVRCKAAVVACGAIHTPALLLRSGLRNEHIGKHLHLHPVSNVCGVFDEEIRPWEGTMQAIYSDQHTQLNGNYGLKYETTALQPVIAAAVLPWRTPSQYRALLEKLPHTSAIGVLVRDRDSGSVKVDRTGWPVTHYALSKFDAAHLRAGFVGAARILEAAGARLIYSPHAKFCSYQSGACGTLDSFAREMDAAGWGAGQVALFSFHIMGTARLGASAGTSVTNPDGECWEARNLYVMDGSSFPSASGVNPMISIAAIAHRNAGVLGSKI
jgi:long-chain-alcohol oxidase